MKANRGNFSAAALMALSLLCACTSTSGAPTKAADAIAPDSHTQADVETESDAMDTIADSTGQSEDTGPSDTSHSGRHDGEADAGKPTYATTAWGTVTGACGTFEPELASTQPSFWVSEYTFNNACSFDPSALASGPQKRYKGDNAGGSSVCSEVMSMQLLADCQDASVHKTEKEIAYTTCQGAITDYIATIEGQLIGVSVTRAYKGPKIDTYSVEDAANLLKKKLAGINESSSKVRPSDKWAKQILHIWTLRKDWVPVLKSAWQNLDAGLRADTVVWVTVEQHPDGQAPWIVPNQCGLK